MGDLEKLSVNVRSSFILEYLETCIRRANWLYNKINKEGCRMTTTNDAVNYIELKKEYMILTDMFNELNIFNWLILSGEDIQGTEINVELK